MPQTGLSRVVPRCPCGLYFGEANLIHLGALRWPRRVVLAGLDSNGLYLPSSSCTSCSTAADLWYRRIIEAVVVTIGARGNALLGVAVMHESGVVMRQENDGGQLGSTQTAAHKRRLLRRHGRGNLKHCGGYARTARGTPARRRADLRHAARKAADFTATRGCPCPNYTHQRKPQGLDDCPRAPVRWQERQPMPGATSASRPRGSRRHRCEQARRRPGPNRGKTEISLATEAPNSFRWWFSVERPHCSEVTRGRREHAVL